MPLGPVLVMLIAVGIVVTLLNRFGGRAIDQPYLSWIVSLILIATALWLLQLLGVFDYVRTIPLPSLRGK